MSLLSQSHFMLIVFSPQTCYLQVKRIDRGRSHKGGRWSRTLISEQNKFQLSVPKIRDIAFYGMFRNQTDQKFHNFYRVCYNFWTIYSGFSLFLTTYINRSLHVGPSEKVQYLTLNHLKSHLLWASRKKITMNESLNVRLQADSWAH